MRTKYRQLLSVLGSALAVSQSGPAVCADGQAFPSRPLRIVVGFSAGGSTDIIARLVAQKLSEALQQPVVVENRTGANGNIAAEAIAKAAPDGHSMLMAANGLTINASLYRKIPYDPVRDFSPITQVAFMPNVLVVHPSLPVRSVKEFIGLARARPGELTHGSSGTGSPGHLAGEVFKMMTSVQFVHVPYKSSAQALVDLLGGHLQLAFPTTFVSMPHIQSGKLRALGVTSLKRSRSLPDTPTIDEAGVRGYEVVGFYGILAPAGVPKEIISRLNDEIVKALRAADLQERLLRDGAEPVGSTAEEFRAYIQKDVGKWARVIDAARIRFEP
jgi:tripartite-type tricarboxylate transporter receptor subunit TctC